MAIWHFKFSLSPTAGLLKVHSHLDVVVGEFASFDPNDFVEGQVFPNYWLDQSHLNQAAMVISSFLPEIRSWSDKARMFGSDETHRVEVWDDDIRCRLDMRTFDYDLLDRLFELAHRFDCKIVVHGSGLVVDPNIESISPHVEASSAYQFCKSPEAFLRSLK